MIIGSIILLNKNFFFFLCFYGSFGKKNDKFMYRIVLNIFVWDKNLKEWLFNVII